jgi:hypothetical protein
MTTTSNRQNIEFAQKLAHEIAGDIILALEEEAKDAAIAQAEIVKDHLQHDASWVLDWVKENFGPGEVFDESDLEQWAMDHGMGFPVEEFGP